MQRRLHSLEGIVAMCALLFVLVLSVGFAQAADRDSIRKIALRSSSALVQDAPAPAPAAGPTCGRIRPLHQAIGYGFRARRRGADEALALAPAHRPVAHARRAAAARADVLREPRRRGARPELSRRDGSVRRCDERKSRGARHEREPLRRADRAFPGQRLDRSRPREDGSRGP